MTFCFTGANGKVKDPEVLTTGMVGKQIGLEFSPEWADLQKTAVFVGGDTVRCMRNAGDVVEIPQEVLESPGTPLYVGVYGVSADGRLVIPTIRVKGPVIAPGANPAEDEQTDPTLPVWASMEAEIGRLWKQLEDLSGLSADQFEALDGMFKVCAFTKGDVSAEYAAFRKAFAQTVPGDPGGEETHTHSYPSAVTTAATCITAGVKTWTCSCGESYTEVIPSTGHHYVDGVCTVCGRPDPGVESGGSGVVAINWLLKNVSYGSANVTDTWGSSEGTASAQMVAPDDGYCVCTTAAASLATYSANAVYVCWPLVSGKTYSITLSNADSATMYLNLFAGKLNAMPVKGEIATVEGELTKAIVSYNGIAAGAAKTYSYTPGADEWLFIKAGKANLLTITAEVTA